MKDPMEFFARRAATESAFLAYDLGRFTDLWPAQDPRDDLTRYLDVDRRALLKLASCRTPRRGAEFYADVAAVCEFAAVEPRRLAWLLRFVDSLRSLQAAPAERHERLLAVARDEGEERTRVETPLRGDKQPRWLEDAVDAIWGNASDTSSFPRDLDFVVLWRLPIAIIELKRLSTDVVSDWLDEHDVAFAVHSAPRPLRAALVAYGGSGLLFVDADDDEAQRRVSVAHEVAHFVADYLLPRERVARRAPDLLDVLDGHREAGPSDQIDAFLRDVPLAGHTHLFERDEGGGYLRRDVDAVEARAARIAWELLAPENLVRKRARSGDRFSFVRVLKSEFGMPSAVARDYATYLGRSSASNRGPRWLPDE